MAMAAKRYGYDVSSFRTSSEAWRIFDYMDYTIKQLKATLTQHNFAFNTSSKLDRLRELAVRADIGFPSYEKCSMRELRSFISQRGLVIQYSIAAPRRAELVTLLEEADESGVFHRFLDLPPELRTQVYVFYLQPLSELLTMHGDTPVVQAPLTRVNKLLRKESLPLQQDIIPLSIRIRRSLTNGQCQLHYSPLCSFIDHAPTELLASLRHFKIKAIFPEPRYICWL